MNGGLDHVGRVGVTMAMRSCDHLAGPKRSVPGLKISSICEYCGTDFERMHVEAGHAVERLLQGDGDELFDLGRGEAEGGVCTSTFGGANSGKTSTLDVGELDEADDHQTRAAKRDDDEPEPQARRGRSSSSSASPPRRRQVSSPQYPIPLLGAVQLGRRQRDHLGPDGRALAEERLSSPPMRAIVIGVRTKVSGFGLVYAQVLPSAS